MALGTEAGTMALAAKLHGQPCGGCERGDEAYEPIRQSDVEDAVTALTPEFEATTSITKIIVLTVPTFPPGRRAAIDPLHGVFENLCIPEILQPVLRRDEPLGRLPRLKDQHLCPVGCASPGHHSCQTDQQRQYREPVLNVPS